MMEQMKSSSSSRETSNRQSKICVGASSSNTPLWSIALRYHRSIEAPYAQVLSWWGKPSEQSAAGWCQMPIGIKTCQEHSLPQGPHCLLVLVLFVSVRENVFGYLTIIYVAFYLHLILHWASDSEQSCCLHIWIWYLWVHICLDYLLEPLPPSSNIKIIYATSTPPSIGWHKLSNTVSAKISPFWSYCTSAKILSIKIFCFKNFDILCLFHLWSC